MWFPLSLFTIAAWAGSDFFSKRGTRPNDKYSHLRLVISVGTVMTIHAVAYLLITGIEWKLSYIILYLPVSFLYILSMTLGYAGLRYIELSVSSPICNSSGAVTSILVFVFLGQTMELMQLGGVIMITAGVILLAVIDKKMAEKSKTLSEDDTKYRRSAIAILFPILYCIIDGLGTFADAYFLEHVLDEASANIAYEFTFGICALISYLYMRVIKKEKFSYIKEKQFTIGAVCETAGQFTYIFALGDNAIVAAPLIASYSVFSVILSRIFLKEKLSRTQYAVIALIMVGIAILGAFDN
ncbi:MAG: EamA family transporter [Ruminococcaceae bacterium]|nr:EamA family transporter [Oscillospiraceae bacterium]